MANRSGSDRTCPHIPKGYFSDLGDHLWCVRCDGSVTPDGSVIPRGQLDSTPPVSRAYGPKIERVLGKRISLRRRVQAGDD